MVTKRGRDERCSCVPHGIVLVPAGHLRRAHTEEAARRREWTGGDVENASFIFGRADTEAVGRSSESAQQRQSYLVPPPPLVRTHSRAHALELARPMSFAVASTASLRAPVAVRGDAASARRRTRVTVRTTVNTSLAHPSRDVEPTCYTSMHSCVHNIHPR